MIRIVGVAITKAKSHKELNEVSIVNSMKEAT